MLQRQTRLIGLFILPLCVAFFGLSGSEERLVEDKPTVRSPEGQEELNQLHADLIHAFKDKRIEKRFLAARKLSRLSKDELSVQLLSAAIESLNVTNPNYKWFVAHYLQKISGKEHGINIQGWREWLRHDYKPVVKEVGEGAVSVSDKPKPKEMTSGSQGHDNPGGVDPVQVEPSSQLGHDPNLKVVDDAPDSQSSKTTPPQKKTPSMSGGEGSGTDTPTDTGMSTPSDNGGDDTTEDTPEDYNPSN